MIKSILYDRIEVAPEEMNGTMNIETAKKLCEINSGFYRDHGDSFSSTRQAPWAGWDLCLPFVRECARSARRELSVLDLACGNLRFMSFLRARLPEMMLHYFAVDNSDDLLPSEVLPLLNYQHLDILGEMFRGKDLNDCLEAPLCDLSVSFGFMHHVPLFEFRKTLLKSLVRQTRTGGYIVVTFWQFLKDERLRTKALSVHQRALSELHLEELDKGDYLLDWNKLPEVYRYCHNFSEEEINQLLKAVGNETALVSRFAADGRGGNLNTYVVLEVL
jgi:SAM-dependent methyltransferase